MNISLWIANSNVVSKDILQAKKGDKDAFVRIIDEHKFMMYRVARSRLQCEEDIEDAFQETLIKAYKGIASLRKAEYFKAWLVKILINECNMIFRKRKEVICLDDNIAENIHFEENGDFQVFDIINSLEEDLRLVSLLYFYEDMPQKEIGKLLDIPHGTVRSRIYRAKEKLREYFENN